MKKPAIAGIVIIGTILILALLWNNFTPSNLPGPGTGQTQPATGSQIQSGTTPGETKPLEQWGTLPIPPLLEDRDPSADIAVFSLAAQTGTTSFFPGKSTPTRGYNGSYLGPVLKVRRGEKVRIDFANELSDATSVHWHGLEIPGSVDGGPHQPIAAGTTWNPVFTIDQPAATLWFHPHVMGTTATQVYEGLAGLILVEDENSQSLDLPDVYGVNDIPLIVQDRSFNANGSFRYQDNMMDGAVGDYLVVNGAITPHLEVRQIRIRFRLVNGANASNYLFNLSDGKSFIQIASDGGLLEAPVEMTELFLSPGERAEIIIDFSGYDKGQTVELRTGREKMMTFRIGEEAADPTMIPDKLTVIEPMAEASVTATKTIRLDGMGHMVSLNGRQFDMDRIDDNVQLGDTEIWEITASRQMMMGSSGHPFHIHGTQFQILSRNGRRPPANEQGWKDTVFVETGETVRLIVRFRFAGVYMYHCHILEHEEAGMMGQLEVK